MRAAHTGAHIVHKAGEPHASPRTGPPQQGGRGIAPDHHKLRLGFLLAHQWPDGAQEPLDAVDVGRPIHRAGDDHRGRPARCQRTRWLPAKKVQVHGRGDGLDIGATRRVGKHLGIAVGHHHIARPRSSKDAKRRLHAALK